MDQGGLNYKLDVSGNLQASLEAIEKRIDSISAKAKTLKGADGSPNRSASSRAETEGEVLLAKKLQSLENQIYLSRQRAVSLKRAELELAKKAEAIARRLSTEEGRQLANMERHKAASKERIKEDARALSMKTRAEAQSRKDQAHIAKEQKRIADYNNIGLQASQRNAAASRELAIKKAQINELTKECTVSHRRINELTKEGTMSQRRAAEQVGITSAQARQLKLNMWDTEHAARQFLFTFRRLVGILAIFTAARKLAQALAMGVKEMSRFNAEIETAEIGIASIVASIAQVRDAQGNLVTGADAFAASLKVSKSILTQIKKDAVGSIATFEALVQAYQVAIGPGLAAGLDLDQVRILSKRLAEGAVSLGVPLNQLSEEIRSLLQGTATARNTRIAALFGGAKEANEAVRNAREQGTLYETLIDKLKGVAQGADAATSSFKVLQSNLQDAVQLLLAAGGLERFESLKEALQGLTQSLMDTGGEDIVFNQEALGLVQEVAGTLAEVVRSFRELTDTASVFATLRNAIGTVGDVLKALAPAASAIFQGMLDGVNTLLAPVRLLGVGLRAVARALGLQERNKSLAEVLKLIVQIVVAVTIWHKLTQAITKLYATGKVFQGLRLGVMYALETVAALKAQGVSLVKITSLTALWNALMTGVATKTAIAGGLWSLLAIAIAVVAVKAGWIDKAINLYNTKIKKAVSSTEDLGASFSGASDSLGDIRSELADIESQVKSMAEDNDLKRALMLVSDTAKDTLEIYLKRDQAIEDATKTQTAAIAKEKEILGTIKEQIAAINKRIALNSGRRGMIQTDLVDKGLLDDAQKRLVLGAQEAKSLREINILEQQRTDAISEINRRTAVQIETKRIEMEEEQRLRTIQIEQLEAAGKLEEANARLLGAAFADQVQARVKLDIIKEQKEVLLEQIRATRDAIKVLNTDTKPEEAVADATAAIAKIEAQLNALKEPTAIKIEIEKAEIEEQLTALRKELSATAPISGFEWQPRADSPERKRLFGKQELLQSRLNNLKQQATDAEIAASKQIYNEQRSLLEQKKVRADQDLIGARLGVEEQKQLIQLKENEQKRAKSKQDALDADALDAQKDYEKAQLRTARGFVNVTNSGLRLGVMEFSESLDTAAESFAQAVEDGLDGVAESFGASFRKYLETGEGVEDFFYNALTDVFLNLAEEFATNVVKNMINELLASQAAKTVGGFISGGGDGEGVLSKSMSWLGRVLGLNTAATTTNSATATANTAATTTDAAATTANTTSTSVNTAASTGNTAAATANSAATTGNSSALLSNMTAIFSNTGALITNTGTLLLNIARMIAQTAATIANTVATWYAGTMSLFGYAKGGLVKGLARGGSVEPRGYAVGGAATLPRPSNIPASDTVPAWLTPGEFVLRRAAVQKYGTGLLESLNRGQLPASFHEAGRGLRRSSATVQHFASGGSVAKSSSVSDSSSPRPVSVAFFDDRSAMKRWLKTTEGEAAILNVVRQNSYLFK